MKIPRTIHYCWFGGNPLGSEELKCIESWRKHFPDYSICRWDESNFNVRCCPYASQAYDAKKWAFVSDYARFAILFEHGGLYFDTDVEVIRPMDDIIAKGPFMGFESDAGDAESSCTVNPGLGLAASPGLELYELILNSYQSDEFVRADGTFDQTTVVTRTTEILRSHGLKDAPGVQNVAGVAIYPSEYFNPKDFRTGEINVTTNTRSIHHFGMSWYSESEKYRHEVESKLLNSFLNENVAHRIAMLATAIRFGELNRITSYLKKRGR